jgi:ABC-type dipeptide/oligopeptide/nickel transport system permease component
MARVVVRRVLQALVTLLGVSVVVFALSQSTGNPVDVLLPVEATPEQRADLIEELGLDKPLVTQYVTFLGNVVQGDFGRSIRTKLPVRGLVVDRLGNSVVLVSASLLFMLVFSLPLGVLAAVKRNTYVDRMAMGLAVMGQSLPPFFTGVLAIIVFSVNWQIFPAQGSGTWQHLVLPAVTMGLFTGAGITRLMRSSMLEVLDSEYAKFARIKGASEMRVVWRHAFRNALIPVVTFVALMYGVLVAAAVTTEVVFAYPGMGRLAYEAVVWRDFPVLQAVVILWAALIVFTNLIVDLSYGIIDPRMRQSG